MGIPKKKIGKPAKAKTETTIRMDCEPDLEFGDGRREFAVNFIQGRI